MKKRIAIGLAVCLLCSGCKKQPDKKRQELSLVAPGGASVSPDDPRAVPLHMTRNTIGAGTEGNWKAIYVSPVGSTVFRIILGPVSGTEFPTGVGSIVAETGTNGQPLLDAMRKAMQAENKTVQVKQQPQLKFTFSILGDRLSPSNKGGFTANPRGDWAAMKLFFDTGDDEAEIFLNLNVVTGDAQFAEKDSDYGNDLLKAFSSVFE